MLGFLEKLKSRKVEVARESASVWQRLVVALADGKEPDPDLVLLELSRLGKTPDDLAAAVALLEQRRAWHAMALAGVQAEVDHPKFKKRIEAEVDAFIALQAAHESTIWPLEQSKSAAAFAMAEAQRARIELSRTARCPLALATVAEADAAVQSLRLERADHERELRAKEDHLTTLQAQRDPGLASSIRRLETDIEGLRSLGVSLRQRADTLAAEATEARKSLERPEAI